MDPTKGKRGSSQGSGSASGDVSHDMTGTRSSEASPKTATIRMSALKQDRLVNWMVDLLSEQIRKVVAMRKTKKAQSTVTYTPKEGTTSLDEVAEVISLPRFCGKTFASAEDHRNVVIEPQVLQELQQYVAVIASHYL
jgi:hypothetical protein